METPAEINVEMLIWHGIWVINRRDLLPRVEFCREFCGRVIHDDHAFTSVAARSPVVITLMAANCVGEPHPRPKKINGAGLSVVLPKNRASLPVFRRQFVVGLGDSSCHLPPAVHVGVDLR